MIFLNAFLIGGLFCLIGQIILDNTKLTPGHITSLFTVAGVVLSFFGIYEKLITYAGAGATMMIANFGHLLYQGGINGYHEQELIGIASGLLSKCSTAIVSAIVFAFIFALFFKPKDWYKKNNLQNKYFYFFLP